MKKSLLLVSALGFCLLVSSCRNLPKPENENHSGTKPSKPDSILIPEETKSIRQTSASGVAGNDTGIVKDTSGKAETHRAIIHRSPEEEKLDSMKKEKNKSK